MGALLEKTMENLRKIITDISLQIGSYVLTSLRLTSLRMSQFDGRRQRSQGLQIDDITHRLE